MRQPKSVATLTELGRVRLSKSFFMRDMLYSEVAALHGLANIPDDPDLAIAAGTRLCEDLLEPLQDHWGRLAIRSAYRSCEVNGFCNQMQRDGKESYTCASNEAREFLERRIGSRWVDLVVLTKMDTGGIVDRHGRMVCVPYLTHGAGPWGGVTRNIELEMILNGWAWVLERYGPDEHYLEALEDARRHRRGIWARDDNVPPWEFKKQKYHRARPGPVSSPQPDLFTALSAKVPCPTNGCGGHLVERTGRFGTFFGCSSYPSCRFSRPT